MVINKPFIFLLIFILIITSSIFLFFPVLGLYVASLATFIVSRMFLKQRIFKNTIPVILTAVVFVLLMDKSFELQGWKIVHQLFQYKEEHKKAPGDLTENFQMRMNSYTPVFTKFEYDNKYDSSRSFFFSLSYTDLWGRTFEYCDKEGEFEIKEE